MGTSSQITGGGYQGDQQQLEWLADRVTGNSPAIIEMPALRDRGNDVIL